VDPGSCPHSGGPNPLAATQCQYCGGALLPLAPPPLDLSRTLPVDYPGLDSDLANPRTNPLLYARIFVLVVALLIFIRTSASIGQPPAPAGTPVPEGNGPDTVFVTGARVSAPPSTCGMNGMTPGAFSVPADAMYPVGWSLPHSGPVPCSVESVSTNTSGCTLSSNLPILVTSADDGEPRLIEIYTPASFNGILYLNFE
jgi:hypothetical protein